jgi:hypothetical protein
MTVASARDTVTPLLRAVEVASVTLGVLLVALLHVVPPTSGIDPLAVTISEYGRSSLAGMFAGAVLLIAIGTTATLVLLMRTGVCRAWSVPSVGIGLWVVGMIGVAVFQKADWAAGATLPGYTHRAASIIAFVSLPVAIFALALSEMRRRPAEHRGSTFDRRILGTAWALAGVILVSIVGLGVLIGLAEMQRIAWWTMFPIGLVERLLVFVELAALALLVAALRLRPAADA